MHAVIQVSPDGMVGSRNCCCHSFAACAVDVTASARMEAESQAHMVGTTLQGVCNVLEALDANGDGKTDFPEFCAMIKEARYIYT